MKIFISWSGERSEALAKALRDWLSLVLHYAQPWLSQSDIQAGDRWSFQVAKELESCNFGILCITRENINSPWLIFEAGALAKSMQDGRVIPLLLDLDFKEISGPLAQFQSKKVDQTDIHEMITSLNKAATTPVPEQQLEKLFSALWGDLEEKIEAIPSILSPVKKQRSQSDILEELVSGVRSVEGRIREFGEFDNRSAKRRSGKYQLMMIHELMHSIAPEDPTRILIVASIYRDDAPWIYEISRELYESIRHGDFSATRVIYSRLTDAVEFIRRGPFIEFSSVERREILFMGRDLFSDLDIEAMLVQKNITTRHKMYPRFIGKGMPAADKT